MGHYLNNLLIRLVRQSEIYPELRKFGLLTHSRPAVAHFESLKTLILQYENLIYKILLSQCLRHPFSESTVPILIKFCEHMGLDRQKVNEDILHP